MISQQQIEAMQRRMSDIQFDLGKGEASQLGRKLASDVRLLLNELESLKKERNER